MEQTTLTTGVDVVLSDSRHASKIHQDLEVKSRKLMLMFLLLILPHIIITDKEVENKMSSKQPGSQRIFGHIQA